MIYFLKNQTRRASKLIRLSLSWSCGLNEAGVQLLADDDDDDITFIHVPEITKRFLLGMSMVVYVDVTLFHQEKEVN